MKDDGRCLSVKANASVFFPYFILFYVSILTPFIPTSYDS